MPVATTQQRPSALAAAPARPLRILFSLFHSGYLRHYGEPIRLLAERGHRIHLSLGRIEKDEGDAALLAKLLEDCPNVSADLAPRRSDLSGWRRIAWFVRGMGDYARYADPRYSDAPALRARIREQVRERLEAQRLDPLSRRALWRLWERLGETTDAKLAQTWTRRLSLLEEAIPPSPATRALVDSFEPDAVLATPVVEFGSGQVEFLKAARARNIPTGVCVSSWDNLTNKGLIRVTPDRVIVWNAIQVRELEELHGIPAERAVVTGAQRYDEWFARTPTRTCEELARAAGIDPAHPFLLYVCSSPFIAPQEVPFVRRWVAALRSSGGPLDDVGVIVRPHPQNTAQWLDADISDLGNAVIWPKRGRMPDDESTRADYFDSLARSAAVVGINTSAFIEAAVVGRATYTLLDPEFAATQEGTLHFQYLRAEHGGVLHVASTIDEHLAQLAAAIENPSLDEAATRSFVSHFVRPCGLEREAAPLVAAAVEELGTLTPEPPVRHASRWALRPTLTLAAGAIYASAAARKSFGRVDDTGAGAQASGTLRLEGSEP